MAKDAPMSLRAAQKQFTRQRLIRAADDLFRERGYAGTTIDDIVAAAGATRATFYLHFRSKSDLVGELMGEIRIGAVEYWDSLAEVFRTGDREPITEWLERTYVFWEKARPAFALEEEAAALEPEFVRLSERSIDDGVLVLVPALCERFGWSEPEARVRAVLMLLQLRTLFHRWRRVGWDTPRMDTFNVVADMWIGAIRATPAVESGRE